MEIFAERIYWLLYSCGLDTRRWRGLCLSIVFYFNYVYIIHSLNFFLFKTEKGKIKVNQLKEWKEFFKNKILLIKVYTLLPSVFILTLLFFFTPGKGINYSYYRYTKIILVFKILHFFYLRCFWRTQKCFSNMLVSFIGRRKLIKNFEFVFFFNSNKYLCFLYYFDVMI